MSDFCSSCHTSYQDVELLADGKCATCLAKEVERLRAQLADSISRETVIATELERDEAREAARKLFNYSPRIARDQLRWFEQYHWLDDTH